MGLLLEVKNLVSGYGNLPIVQDVSLSVVQGDILAIIGPNGSGKSTLVKAIFGMADVMSGGIVFNGKEITKSKTQELARMGLSFVPQVSNVFPDLTIKENLELGTLGNSEKSSRKEAIQIALKTFPVLSERITQRAGTLSGGERQMLAVARTLVARPKLLVLDEPTAALAPIIAEQLFQKLDEIHSSGVTLILVEQNALRALKFAAEKLVKSPYGRLLKSIRDDPVAAESLGKDINKARRQIMVIGSAMAGLAGGLYVFYIGVATTEDYVSAVTFSIWVIMILGGFANNKGVLAGALILNGLDRGSIIIGTLIQSAFPGFNGDLVIYVKYMIEAVILLLLLVYRPKGMFPEKPVKTVAYDEFRATNVGTEEKK